MPKYSIIIPVYNRPNEVDELLESLCAQTCKDFEVLVVEDGSTNKCDFICEKYTSRLNLNYIYKQNSGPGQTRNFGVAQSNGEYVIFLDSDTIVPPVYIAEIEKELNTQATDAFGGPDRANKLFSNIQKAISYSMTSFYTTGGIRGGKKKMDKFYPRSFNMGLRRAVFDSLGGFSKMRYGEDIDLSTRIFKNNYLCRLFSEAWVYHKRRSTFVDFFKQVRASGRARVTLWHLYPDTLKIVHLLPAVFFLSNILFVVLGVFCSWLWFLPIIIYAVLIFTDSLIKNKSIKVAALSVAAAYVQLFGYGIGFLCNVFNPIVKQSTTLPQHLLIYSGLLGVVCDILK